MSRTQRIQELVQAEFPFFSFEIWQTLNEIERESRKGKQHDTVKILWERHRAEIFHLVQWPGAPRVKIKAHVLNASRRKLISAKLAAATKLMNEMNDLSNDELKTRYDGVFRGLEKANREKSRWLAEENDEFAFFNLPRAEADFTEWCSKAVWSQQEAVALSLGKEPSRVNQSVLDLFNPIGGSVFRAQYEERADQIRRSVESGDLRDSMRPAKFVSWAIERGHALPEPLTQLLGSGTTSGNLHGGRRNSLLGLALGFAAKHYPSFDGAVVKKPGSAVLAAMCRDLLEVGISLDPKTIGRIMEDALKWAHDLPDQTFVQKAKKRKPGTVLPNR